MWLPAIASGEKLVAVAVTEPDHGSDVASITCRANRLPAGDWEITGTKLWCTFAGRSELLMILQTLFPWPVAPAISRCGMRVKSAEMEGTVGPTKSDRRNVSVPGTRAETCPKAVTRPSR